MPEEIIAIKSSSYTRVVQIMVLVLVLAILAGILIFKYFIMNGQPKVSNELPENYHYLALAQGNYPKGFPEKVIVSEKDIKGEWQRSEDTIAGDGKRFKVAELIYKKADPSVLAPLFENSFKAEGWIQSTSKNSSDPVARTFDKVTAGIGETATVIIIKLNEDSLVNITISTK